MRCYLFLTLSLSMLQLHAQSQSVPGWPVEAKTIQVVSTADNSPQPSVTWSPADDGQARPLLVGLHTWSGDYRQSSNGPTFLRWAMQHGWHFVAPNFRGANHTPAALGSDLAVQDIVDAVNFMKKNATVDADRVYLIGASGGGHMSLLMAGRHPEIWAGVSAWVGIADLEAWHGEHVKAGKPDKYARDIEGALGGPPDSPERIKDAHQRSPQTWLAAASSVALDINHGVHDGRAGSVPFRHSLLAFNSVVGEADRLPVAQIHEFYDTQKLPAGWPAATPDPLYEGKPVVFRKVSGKTRITIFDGGHEILYLPSLNWLAQQRRGKPVVWTVEKPDPISSANTKSGL
ncbi:MAG: alpha/beta fold hydrolase [Verrucomicrobiales bacterium]|nr:alpha/beta fold hydrolase [Verrucomicrobiales bacterium]